MATSESRRQAVHDFKRAAILDAARRVFAASGPGGATVRAIAGEAGYSPGAIYAYYPAKEEIYGDILADSLAQAGQAVKQAGAGGAQPEARLAASVGAYYAYYRAHPREFELGLHLLREGARALLSAERDRLINGRLIALLQVIAAAVGELGGLSADEAALETVAILSQLSGILMLEQGGRLEVLGQDGEGLLAHYLAGLTARLGKGE